MALRLVMLAGRYMWLRRHFSSSSTPERRQKKLSAKDSIKLLYVEDSADIRYMVAFTLPLINEMFPRENWPSVEVIEAEDGLAGVAKAREYTPDVILMDLRMPRMNGAEAAIQIRHDPRTSHIPIIMITAFQEERVQEEAEKVGAERAMRKPFEWHELMTTIVDLANVSP
jgi:CheY-like chemotaxis protein